MKGSFGFGLDEARLLSSYSRTAQFAEIDVYLAKQEQ